MGLFDGVITQLDGMFQQRVKPMFDELSAELAKIQGTDAHLDATIAALDAHLQAQTAFTGALIQQMKAMNAHPTVAAKKPVGAA